MLGGGINACQVSRYLSFYNTYPIVTPREARPNEVSVRRYGKPQGDCHASLCCARNDGTGEGGTTEGVS